MVGNVNYITGCEDCRFADAYGRGCEKNLLLPLVVLMSGRKCDEKKPKTKRQLEEQYKQLYEKKDN